jgi:DNA-binding phage protein
MPTSRSYHLYLIESLKDPQEAAAYLDAVLEDGNYEELYLALKNVLEAQATLSDTNLANEQDIAQQLLSQPTNLDLSTLLKVLDALGFKLSVMPKQHVA